jgi:NAD(P)H-flavin reductase/ferredoxin
MTELRILPFDATLEVEPGESVLKAILRQGKFVKYGCKHGGCSSCRAEVIEGDFTLSDNTSFSLSEKDRDAGIVLLCSTYADTDLTIDVSVTMDDLDEIGFNAGQETNEVTGTVDRREMLSHDIVWIGLKLDEGVELPFVAGQYVEVKIPGSEDTWRSFSMANAPGENNRVDLIIKIIPGGAFGTALKNGFEIGERVDVRGPFGTFAVRWSHRPMIMIAGGSGMAPILAILKDLAANRNKRDVLFIYGARQYRDLILTDELEKMAAEHEWFTYVPALSEHDASDMTWGGEVGLVTEVLAARVPSTEGYEGYLCGPPPMIDAAIDVLQGGGCKPKYIYFDRFVPSG